MLVICRYLKLKLGFGFLLLMMMHLLILTMYQCIVICQGIILGGRKMMGMYRLKPVVLKSRNLLLSYHVLKVAENLFQQEYSKVPP